MDINRSLTETEAILIVQSLDDEELINLLNQLRNQELAESFPAEGS